MNIIYSVPPVVTDTERNALIQLSGAVGAIRGALPTTTGVQNALNSFLIELGTLILQTSA